MSSDKIESVLENHSKVKSVQKSPSQVEFTTSFAGPTIPTGLARQLDKVSETETILRYSDAKNGWVLSAIDGGIVR